MDERSRRVEKRLAGPMLVAAILVIPVIAVEESSVGRPWEGIAGALNWAIWVAFAFELIAMLWVVPDRARWLRTHPLEVVIVVLTPPFLPASLQAARALRLLRLLRLVRLAQLAPRVFSLEGVRYSALLAAMTALGGGAAFAALEKDVGTWDGVFWAFTTMTTVGYGELAPDTDGGRMLAMAVMLVGIGFVAILTGAIAERFLARQAERPAQEVEAPESAVLEELRRIGDRLAALEARHAGESPTRHP